MPRSLTVRPRTALLGLWAMLCAWLVAPVAHAAEPLAFEARAQPLGSAWCPTEQRRIAVTLRNVGTEPWVPEERDHLSYHWLGEDGSVVVRDGLRTVLPRSVSPGEVVEVDALVQAPDRPGSYELAWAMVREQVRWYPLPPGSTTSVQVRGRPPPFRWSAEVAQVGPLAARAETTVRVQLTNEGCATWSQLFGDALSYHWLDTQGRSVVSEGVRTPLPRVEPGQTVSVDAKVVGGPDPGRHVLVIEPVRENVNWFGPPTGPSARAELELGPAALAWSLLDDGAPTTMHAGDVVTVDVRVRNDGTQPWRDASGDRLSYRWERIDPEGEAIEGMRTALPEAVQPTEVATLRARLAAPTEPGRYRLRWEPVREGVTWYGPSVAPIEPRTVDIEPPRLAWSLVSADPPVVLWVGRHAEVDVTVRNAGTSTWDPGRNDRLSYRWYDEDGQLVPFEGLRTELPEAVAPGQTVTLPMRVLGPPTPGTYRLEVEMVREHVAWFGPPTDGEPSMQIPVHRQSGTLGLWFLGAIAAVVIGARRAARQERWRPVVAWVSALAWPLWLAVVAWLLGEAFSDLSGLEFWEGGRVAAASCGALLGLFVALLPARVRPVVAVSLAVFWSLLTVADLAYHDFFGSLVPLSALGAGNHLWDAARSVASLMRPVYAWVMLLPLTGLPLALGIPRVGESTTHARARALVPIAVLLLCSLPGSVALGRATASPRGDRVFSEAQNAGQLGLVGAHLFQMIRGLAELSHREPLDPNRLEEVRSFYGRRALVRGETPNAGVARGMNVVVIQVEALQSWAVGAVVDGQPVTPFLDRARSDATIAMDVFDQTAQGRTSDAEYLVLASNHALQQGALSFSRADAGFVTVAHALADHGYETVSAHPYRRGFWNRAALHPRYGFASSLFRRELGTGPSAGWGLADGPFLERMVERLADASEPFFAFLITLSLHHPYPEFPSGLSELELGRLDKTSVGNYLQAMRHFDTSLAELFAGLEDQGLRHRTVVVIYGDHVAGLGDGPEVLRFAGIERWDPSVSTRLRRVPLFVWVPGVDASEVRTAAAVAGQIDIGPTVLHLLGVDAPPSFVGMPLGSGADHVALPDGAVIGADRMLVRSGQGIPADGRCFDLPEGTPRPRSDCEALQRAGEAELNASRTLLDHDLFDALR